MTWEQTRQSRLAIKKKQTKGIGDMGICVHAVRVVAGTSPRLPVAAGGAVVVGSVW